MVHEAAGEAVQLEETQLITSMLIAGVNIINTFTLNNNLRFGGKDYLVSWRIGCSQFTQAGAEHFCKLNGMR